MSRLTAMMSARWIMTSAMRRSCSERILRSMVRSTALKPTSSGAEASSTTLRSSRTDPGLKPNSVRIARTNQFSLARRPTSFGVTTAGRLRVLRGLSWIGSESGISVHPFPFCIGVGNPELRENVRLQNFHRFGVVVRLVIVANQMQKAVHREMAQVVSERLVRLAGFPAYGLIGDRDVAEHPRGIVRSSRGGCLRDRKRQHIGRLVDAAKVLVERADAGIVSQQDCQFGPSGIDPDRRGRCGERPLDNGLGIRLVQPAVGGGDDLGDG